MPPPPGLLIERHIHLDLADDGRLHRHVGEGPPLPQLPGPGGGQRHRPRVRNGPAVPLGDIPNEGLAELMAGVADRVGLPDVAEPAAGVVPAQQQHAGRGPRWPPESVVLGEALRQARAQDWPTNPYPTRIQRV